MAWTAELGAVQFGLARPVALLALPVAALAVAYLVGVRAGVERDEDGSLDVDVDVDLALDTDRRRLLVLGSRLLVVLLVVGAMAGPFTVEARETSGDPRVTMLVDESNSMSVAPTATDRLAEEIEAEGVPVSVRPVASENRSRLGDAIVSGVRENGSLLVVSDGQVTGGRSLSRAAELARSVNATVYAVPASPNRTEAAVAIEGPRTTGVDTDNRFVVRVDGANVADRAFELTVSVDGEVINRTTVTGGESVLLSRTFEETGTHRVTARIAAEDRFAANDVARRTVEVVEQPRVLYVARELKPLTELLRRTYDVDRAERVPSGDELDPYQAVVIQDMPPTAVGNVTALQQYVVDGGGLVVVGGPNAYTNGDYESSPLSVMLPVREGTDRQGSRIVLTVDISQSAEPGIATQKALALDVIDQLGDENRVGIVAFNEQPFLVAEPRRLGEFRGALEQRVRRLRIGGGTSIAAGLDGAGQLLGQGGTVILLSDGRDKFGGAPEAASSLRAQGTRVISVGVGEEVNENVLREVAARSDGGTYFRADETARLRLLFGDQSREFQGRGLTVVDSTQFITRGVTLTAAPGRSHRVTVKQGADLLVAGGSTGPAVSSWSYGLGRSVAVTAYAPDGTLGGLLSAPDSLLLTRSVNWAIGDPTRGRTGVTDIEPAEVGRETTVTYVGETRPETERGDLRFVRTGPTRFQARLVPSEPGYDSVLGRSYAVNYPRELGRFGPSPALTQAVEATGGRTFEAGEAAAIADAVERQYRQVRTVRQDWGWLLLTVGLLVYLAEVVYRRLSRYAARPSTASLPWN